METIQTAPKDGTEIFGFYDGWFPMQWSSSKQRWELSGCCWADETTRCQPTHWLPMPPEPAMATTQTGGDGFYWALFDDANPEIVELADGGTTLYRIGTDMAAFLKDGQWFAGDGPFEIAKLVGPLNAPILQKQVHDLTK